MQRSSDVIRCSQDLSSIDFSTLSLNSIILDAKKEPNTKKIVRNKKINVLGNVGIMYFLYNSFGRDYLSGPKICHILHPR